MVARRTQAGSATRRSGQRRRGQQEGSEITGEITPGVFGWAGAMFFPGSAPMAPVNLSSKSAISFWTKGDGKTYQVMFWAKSKGALPLLKSFTAGPEWTQVVLPLSDFGADGHDLKAIMFAGLAIPGSFRFLIDDVRLDTVVPAQRAAAVPSVAKRVFGVLPNYKTVEPGASTKPLTEHEKFVMATKDTVHPPLLFVSGGLAGWSQSKNQDASFRQAGHQAPVYETSRPQPVSRMCWSNF